MFRRCCAKFELGQPFHARSPNISFTLANVVTRCVNLTPFATLLGSLANLPSNMRFSHNFRQNVSAITPL